MVRNDLVSWEFWPTSIMGCYSLHLNEVAAFLRWTHKEQPNTLTFHRYFCAHELYQKRLHWFPSINADTYTQYIHYIYIYYNIHILFQGWYTSTLQTIQEVPSFSSLSPSKNGISWQLPWHVVLPVVPRERHWRAMRGHWRMTPVTALRRICPCLFRCLVLRVGTCRLVEDTMIKRVSW